MARYTVKLYIETEGGAFTTLRVPISDLTASSLLQALDTGYYEGRGSIRVSLVSSGTGIGGNTGTGAMTASVNLAGAE